MAQSLNELEFRNKELEQFANVASHDLQEPLRKIQTFAELLGKNLDDKAAIEKNLERINSSAQRMSALVKDILSYSRLANTDSQFTEVDLNKVFQTIKNNFEHQIIQKKVVIKSEKLPVIRGNMIQLHQLFSNLISNSLKFTSDRQPEITISSEFISGDRLKNNIPLNSGTTYIKLIFKDNGIGFEHQYAEVIFKLFQRLNGIKNYKGNGIGLGICRKIVENHHGFITAAGEPGKGATFTIYMPKGKG